MAYSQGGLIEATDYNNFINGSNQLNTVWSTGTGNSGYGQTAIGTVSASGAVTATQWASLINTLNNSLNHQAGSGSGISATTAGTRINYLTTLATNINTAYTNRLNRATTGTTVTGSTTAVTFTDANGQGPFTHSFTRWITFASGDAARYFFNAGGQINFVISSVSNNDATTRSASIATLVGTQFGGFNGLRTATSGGRIGTGGNAPTTNVTTSGYYNLTTSPTTWYAQTADTAAYTSDTVTATITSNGSNLSGHGDAGSNIAITVSFTSAVQAQSGSPLASFNDSSSRDNLLV